MESPTTSNLSFPIITSGLSWEIVMMLLVQALHLKDGSAFNFPLILVSKGKLKADPSLVNPVVIALAEDRVNANTFVTNTAWPFYGI